MNAYSKIWDKNWQQVKETAESIRFLCYLLYLPLVRDYNVQQILHLSMLLSGGHPEILCDTFQHFHPGHKSHISLWKDQDKVSLANFQKTNVKNNKFHYFKKVTHWHICHNQIPNLFLWILTSTNINLFLLTPFKDNKQVINCIFVAIKCFDTVTEKMKRIIKEMISRIHMKRLDTTGRQRGKMTHQILCRIELTLATKKWLVTKMLTMDIASTKVKESCVDGGI